MPEIIDEFHGVGGSYILNPKTGKRTLVERTQDAVGTEIAQSNTEASANAPAIPTPDNSGEN